MANNKKNEELQSRRDFFKKATKGVLPVFGAIMLAGIPNLIKAEEVHMGCQYGCSGGCDGNCRYTCYGSCKNGCDGCKYTCTGTCKNACTGCRYTCDSTCKNGCVGSNR